MIIIIIKLSTVINSPPISVTAHKGMLSKKPQSSTAVTIGNQRKDRRNQIRKAEGAGESLSLIKGRRNEFLWNPIAG